MLTDSVAMPPLVKQMHQKARQALLAGFWCHAHAVLRDRLGRQETLCFAGLDWLEMRDRLMAFLLVENYSEFVVAGEVSHSTWTDDVGRYYHGLEVYADRPKESKLWCHWENMPLHQHPAPPSLRVWLTPLRRHDASKGLGIYPTEELTLYPDTGIPGLGRVLPLVLDLVSRH